MKKIQAAFVRGGFGVGTENWKGSRCYLYIITPNGAYRIGTRKKPITVGGFQGDVPKRVKSVIKKYYGSQAAEDWDGKVHSINYVHYPRFSESWWRRESPKFQLWDEMQDKYNLTPEEIAEWHAEGFYPKTAEQWLNIGCRDPKLAAYLHERFICPTSEQKHILEEACAGKMSKEECASLLRVVDVHYKVRR